MRTNSSTTVTSFLTGIANTAEVLAGYSGSPRVFTYTGPHKFYRAAGRTVSGSLARAYGGQWWADESTLIKIAAKLQTSSYWMTVPEQKRAWPAQYRALTALCGDWNDMSEMLVLELPTGDSIEGLTGPAKEQPEFSAKDPHGRHNPNRILSGGAEQIFFKVKNPLWIRQVHL